MTRLFLVIVLGRNVVVGVFATKQEAELYVDSVDQGYRGQEYIVVPVDFDSEGKIVPNSDVSNDIDDDDVSVKFYFTRISTKPVSLFM